MNILLLNQYFPPDVAPTGLFLHDIAQTLRARGHTITVLCSNRSYEDGRHLPRYEMLNDVRVLRTASFGFGRVRKAGKLLGYLTFSLALCFRMLTLRPKPDLILALTTPPYLGLLAKLVCRCRGCRHAHWLMDLYPDVMRAHGLLRAGSFTDRLLSDLTRWQLKGSALSVVLGDDMADRMAAYAPDSRAVLCVPLWASQGAMRGAETAGRSVRASRGWSEQDFVLMYSGNMGRGHRFSEFLNAAARTSQNASVRWVFAGAGPRRSEIENFAAQHPEAALELLPYAPSGELLEHLASADVHLVSMDPAWQGSLVPSKLQNVFALGKPVIFVGETNNSIAQWIRESGGGWIVGCDDVECLLRAIAEARQPDERARRGAAARAYAERHFDPQVNCAAICDALEAQTRISA